MRKTMIAAAASALLTMALAGTVSAHQAGPCNPSPGPGHSEFAAHHIVPFAQEGDLGAGGHKPGGHQGFSLCNPSVNRP
jgi:hypothetical protein